MSVKWGDHGTVTLSVSMNAITFRKKYVFKWYGRRTYFLYHVFHTTLKTPNFEFASHQFVGTHHRAVVLLLQ